MLWFYTSEQQSLTVETRFDNDSHEYVATVMGATGIPESTRFKSADEFRTWLVALERNLTAQRWRSDGPPHIFPEGWPQKKPLQ
jgi:hypothetical protein